MMKDEDPAAEFLLRDFEQQYEEYRQAEISRLHYVQFFISIVVAVIAFFAALYESQFPAQNIYVTWLLFLIAAVLSFIGYAVISICTLARNAQMQTAIYLNKIVKHFLKSDKYEAMKTSREEVYFAKKDWASVKTPFFGLMKILVFLLAVLCAISSFSLSRILFFYLGTIGIPTLLPAQSIFSFLHYASWGFFISGSIGVVVFIVTYRTIKCKVQSDLKELRKKASEKNT